MNNVDMNKKIAVFGGGCFWCTEAVFSMLKGILNIAPGYAGGTTPNPVYEEVCSDKTGHAEVIKIEYNPEKISYRDLLTVFFATHNPTELNRQGNDIGTQYRSVVFYADDHQRREAEDFIKELNSLGGEGAPIVTEVKPLENFYPAEDYHKNYYAKNPKNPYCQAVINPKLEKVQKKFTQLLSE